MGRLRGIIAVAVLLGAGCGGDDDESDGTDPPSGTAAGEAITGETRDAVRECLDALDGIGAAILSGDGDNFKDAQRACDEADDALSEAGGTPALQINRDISIFMVDVARANLDQVTGEFTQSGADALDAAAATLAAEVLEQLGP